ncbi:hypothetical protein FRC00_005832 [Tulasnella sp. 408]|nr:hypothetical protein FRC00_005832 [Tulasnella sp. 408]
MNNIPPGSRASTGAAAAISDQAKPPEKNTFRISSELLTLPFIAANSMANNPLPEAGAEVPQETRHPEVPPSGSSSESSNLASTARIHLPMDSNDLITVQDLPESEFTAISHILKVDQVLFRVSADILRLCRSINEPTASSLIISGLTAAQLRSFLTVATAKTIQSQFSPSIEDWISALHAATQLGCSDIGRYAINSINRYVAAFQPVHLIQLGLRYQVSSWARLGFTRLIERDEHLSSEEGTNLGMDLVLAIYRSRETLARVRNVGEHTTSMTELINNEPSLKTPTFAKLVPIKFQASADSLTTTEDSLHYQTSLVDLLVDDTVWRVTMATLGSTSYFLKRADRSKIPIDGEFPVIDLSGEVDRAELESYLWLVNARHFENSSGESLELEF